MKLNKFRTDYKKILKNAELNKERAMKIKLTTRKDIFLHMFQSGYIRYEIKEKNLVNLDNDINIETLKNLDFEKDDFPYILDDTDTKILVFTVCVMKKHFK